MYFYVDESGHTGANLFDLNQPILYYGVLVARQDLTSSAEDDVASIRNRLGVERLHANHLGQGGLVEVAGQLRTLQQNLSLEFDVYRINKSDHTVIQFFDQVFDSGMNDKVPWSSYWTVRRYLILLDLAIMFDDPLRRAAWAARLERDPEIAANKLSELCKKLLKRIGRVRHEGTRRIIRRALMGAAERPSEVAYGVGDKTQAKQITPNIVGFQFVMSGIAKRTREGGSTPTHIVVDRQGEFNGAQRVLSDFYAQAAGIKLEDVPGVMEVNFEGMPQIPVTFCPGDENCGLELADLYTWLFKLFLERKTIATELQPLIDAQMGIGNFDELSLQGIRHRVARLWAEQPELFRSNG